MKATEIVSEIALMLGFDLPPVSPEETDHSPGLRERIMIEIEKCACEAISQTPRSRLTGWRLLPTEGLTSVGEGAYLLPLPSDFLLLHSVSMSDWKTEATEVVDHDHWLARAQRGCIPALKATPRCPLAAHALTEDGQPALLLYGSREETATASGWYMPRPEIDSDGEIFIPPASSGIFKELMSREIGRAHDIFHTGCS